MNAAIREDVSQAWDNSIRIWELDHTQRDPYQEPKEKCEYPFPYLSNSLTWNIVATLSDCKLFLATEDAKKLKNANQTFPHDVSPGTFIGAGLDLEEEQ